MDVDNAIYYLIPDVDDFLRSLEQNDDTESDVLQSQPSALPVYQETKTATAAKPELGSDADSYTSARTTPSQSSSNDVQRSGGDNKRIYRKKASRVLTPWTAEEEVVFLAALAQYGLDHPQPSGQISVGLGSGVARKIAELVGSRTPSQVRSHAQKHFERLKKLMGHHHDA